MDIKVILNRIEKHKGFVYGKARWAEEGKGLLIPLAPRRGSRPVCSGCGRKGSAYDRLPARRFQFVPLWGMTVFLVYAMRRVTCPVCGVKVEAVPWAAGKRRLTRSFALFLARWARRLSWQETALCFGTTWNRVYDAVRWAVDFGLNHRDLSPVEAVGVDEIQFGHGHQYLTLVYRIDAGARQLLYIGRDRTARTLLRFFHDMGRDWCGQVKFVCSDMWKPYLKVIAKKLPKAVHILDRFHIVAKLNDAVDEVRRAEAKRMRAEGYEEVLAKSKYCFLKRPENLTGKQEARLKDVLQYDLRSVRAYLLKESFQLFWTYTSPYWACWFLRKWCTRAMRSKLYPLKKFVVTIRRHEELILNWFKAKKAFSSGVVEGLNRKVNLITRRSFGFRSLTVLETALYHTLGDLPEPTATHRFC
jgi:transposase